MAYRSVIRAPIGSQPSPFRLERVVNGADQPIDYQGGETKDNYADKRNLDHDRLRLDERF